MCTGKCAKCIAVVLYPLALISIICNILLFFPDWKTEYAQSDSNIVTLTPEVTYMGGLLGGGIMVLVPAIHIHLTGKVGCCANRCGMFLSIGFAALGVVGALYSMSVAALGLSKGPICRYWSIENPIFGQWGRPFDNNGTYLSNPDSWKLCLEPENVVEFNVALFAVLLATACLELGLCGFQMVNGLFGCLCGTCRGKEDE
ncbi:transmembrane 4 L6 family member 5 [Alosa sapidissima]|uniref:transmembrane 4 L6 family member 5 n=1 Tax=Alosa sapidissima TaxID=34773 RepID=UPI001C09BAD7|nr:transmembrane 4 L6 family member 5 [Alosa sapidissima]